MAPTSKRKRTVDDELKTRKIAEVPTELNDRLQAIKRPSSNVWEKLPAEVKNMIYDMAIGSQSKIAVHLQKRAVPQGLQRSQTSGLLLTSKSIHKEAAGFYYHGNGFELYVRVEELQEASSWLNSKFTSFGPASKIDFRVTITTMPWGTIDRWFQLAEFVHMTDLGSLDQEALINEWEKKITTLGCHKEWPHPKCDSCDKNRALSKIIGIAVETRSSGKTVRELATMFYQCATSIIAQPGKHPKSKALKEAAWALRKGLIAKQKDHKALTEADERIEDKTASTLRAIIDLQEYRHYYPKPPKRIGYDPGDFFFEDREKAAASADRWALRRFETQHKADIHMEYAVRSEPFPF